MSNNPLGIVEQTDCRRAGRIRRPRSDAAARGIAQGVEKECFGGVGQAIRGHTFPLVSGAVHPPPAGRGCARHLRNGARLECGGGCGCKGRVQTGRTRSTHRARSDPRTTSSRSRWRCPGRPLSLTLFFLVGSILLFIATCVVIWRLAHVRNTTRGMVGNHSQVNRSFLKKHAKDEESGIVHTSSATDTTTVVKKRR